VLSVLIIFAELSSLPPECSTVQPREFLRTVLIVRGVERAEVQSVLARSEVGDHVTVCTTGILEDEPIVPRSATQLIRSPAADQDVVSTQAVEHIGPVVAAKLVALVAAADVFDIHQNILVWLL
jgi:hypothetical protein